MSGFKCPHCNSVFPITTDTFRSYYPHFDGYNGQYRSAPLAYSYKESAIELNFYLCPACKKYIITARGMGAALPNRKVKIFPSSSVIQYPDYVPEAIRSDYEEACAIQDLSPKASATLSRRCLQNMIRDFWKISESTLYKEIESLEEVIPATQKKVLHSLRQIGNIGAHPEADINTIIDINPEDTSKLIKVIEFFIQEWYMDRYEQEQLFEEIDALNIDLQSQKKSNE